MNLVMSVRKFLEICLGNENEEAARIINECSPYCPYSMHLRLCGTILNNCLEVDDLKYAAMKFSTCLG